MSKIIDKHGRVRRGKPRDLYNDADSEQAEGLEDPLSEPMRDGLRGHPREDEFDRSTDRSARGLDARARHARE
jgi:hypothetical protein